MIYFKWGAVITASAFTPWPLVTVHLALMAFALFLLVKG